MAGSPRGSLPLQSLLRNPRAMGRAHGDDLRWRAIYSIYWDGLDPIDVAKKLSCGPLKVTPKWVMGVWKLYEETGDACLPKQHRVAHNRKLLFADAQLIINAVLDDPECMLIEHHATFEAASGKSIHLSTFCRAVHGLSFTRQKLQQYAVNRDEHMARVWREKFAARGWKAHQILAVDETSKDMRMMRRSMGYAIRGSPPVGRSGLAPRGERISSLCSFDVNGFVAWSHNDGTYNTDGFLEAAQKVIYEKITPYPGPRSIVLIDNAPIHRNYEFVRQCKMRGAIVLFTTPYCWDQMPLDNSAFGRIKDWIRERFVMQTLLGRTTRQILDDAFLNFGHDKAATARHFFSKCGYPF